jgi:hypothetical protein
MTPLVIKALNIAVKSPLYLKYDGKFFLQKRGIPMGQACSPDIAQIYASHFEKGPL